MALGQILTQSMSRNEYRMPPAARPPALHSPASQSKNISRLLSAAAINRRFCALLLSDPVAALAAGYNGQRFQLTPAEYAVVTSLRVTTLSEFADQLLHIFENTTVEPGRHEREPRTEFQYAKVTS